MNASAANNNMEEKYYYSVNCFSSSCVVLTSSVHRCTSSFSAGAGRRIKEKLLKLFSHYHCTYIYIQQREKTEERLSWGKWKWKWGDAEWEQVETSCWGGKRRRDYFVTRQEKHLHSWNSVIKIYKKRVENCIETFPFSFFLLV